MVYVVDFAYDSPASVGGDISSPGHASLFVGSQVLGGTSSSHAVARTILVENENPEKQYEGKKRIPS